MQTPEQKRAADAARAKRYRENRRKRAAAEQEAAIALPATKRDAKRDEKPDIPTPPTKPERFTMVASVTKAIAAMKWIQDSDGALVDMAKLYAVQIDQTLADDPTATGKAASLGQLLTRILHELGGTPTVRLQHELRSMRLSAPADPMSGDSDAGTDDEDSGRPSRRGANGATVTSIKRPAKRKQTA